MLDLSGPVVPIIMGATGNIQGSFLHIGESAIIVGAVVLGPRKGWALFRGMIEGSDPGPYTGKDYSGHEDDESSWS
jgi:hypothetical protein